MTSYEHLSDSEMADEITTWAGRIAAGEAHLVGLIGEFDRREAWSAVGMLSCAHWLSLRLGMGLKAAHERVRVSRALPFLPVTAEAFAGGRLSWTQVRAITRVAAAEDEQTYVDLARHATGAQIERLVRGVRRARRFVEDEADPRAAAHRMRTRISYDADGTLVLTVRMPAEQGAVMLAAVEQARAVLDRPAAAAQSSAEDSAHAGDDDSAGKAERPVPATQTDAVLHLARTFLETTAATQPDVTRRSRSHLVAHLDPISGWARLHDGELLPASSVAAIGAPLPSPDQMRPLTEADLTAADLGRAAREPSLALRELLGAVDGERCRFPGCTRHRRLHAHHLVYWSAGGRTDLANLLLLCSRHHTLVHAQGFRLNMRADRTLSVATADGVPVLHHPALPWQPAEDLDRDRSVTPTTLPPAAFDPLDLRYAVAVLTQQAA